MLRTVAALTISVTSLFACATESPDDLAPGAGGKADGEAPVIVLDAEWNETTHGTLLAGSPVLIDYDLDRMQGCRGSTGGSEVWGVSGYASFDGGAPVSFSLSRLDLGRVVPIEAELAIPGDAEHMELWFTINNRWGCIQYDSNYGANYQFDIERNPNAGASLSFDADGSESQSSAIRAGAPLAVHYQPARLAQCAASSMGNPAWGITGYYRVDGGTVKSLAVARASNGELVAADASFVVPRGAGLDVWFEATNRYGCHATDATADAPYHFTIE